MQEEDTKTFRLNEDGEDDTRRSEEETNAEALEQPEEDGISEIPDDTPRKRMDEQKRKLSRAVKRVSDSQKKRGKKKMSVMTGMILIVLVLILIFLIADVASGGTVNGKFVSVFSRYSSQHFSAAIDGDTVYAFEPYASGYAVLTEYGIQYVDSSGDTTASQQITYGAPALDTAGKRAVIFDRGGSNYIVERKQSVALQLSSSENILDAAVSRKNNYALAVKGEKTSSSLIGYKANGDVIYQWDCPNGYIADVAIAPAGNKAAVMVMNAANAVLTSTVYILDFEYDTAYAQFQYSDETVLGMKFLSDKKLLVISEKDVYLITGTEQSIVYGYGTSEIAFADIGDHRLTAVVTQEYSKDDSYILSIFSKSGKLLTSVPLAGKVKGVSASDKSVAVLFSDKTETYSKRGVLVGQVSDLHSYSNIVLNGNYVFLQSSAFVKKYPAYGMISAADLNTDSEMETSYR